MSVNHYAASSNAQPSIAVLQPRWRMLIAMVPVVLVALLAWYKLVDRDAYWMFVQEDGPAENLTALIYILSSTLAGVVAFHLWRARRMWYMLAFMGLAVGFFLIAGEEISWGQRMFAVQTPEFFEQYNHQHEMNLHNFANRRLLHLTYIAVAGFGACAWLFLPRMARRFLSPQLQRDAWLVTPPPMAMGYFLPALLLYVYYDYIDPIIVRLFGEQYTFDWDKGERFFIIARDQEPIEAILSLAMLVTVAYVLYGIRKGALHAKKR